MLGECLDRVRSAAPLIHCITNYVTANDVANLLLAAGARPVMADDEAEAAEITASAQGLTLNLGTLHKTTIPAMLASGRTANRLGLPVVLDPVGVGASAFRREAGRTLTAAVRFAAIRGNPSELKALAGGEGRPGVDGAAADAVTEANLDAALARLGETARSLGTVVAATGAIDLVTDGRRGYILRNGRREMGKITGTGCQLSALTAAFLAANPERPLEAVAAAVCAMGVAGELAWDGLAPGQGSMAARARLIDAIYHMTGQELEKGARIEVR